MKFFGYLILIIFIIFLLTMIRQGPYIFERGTNYFINISDLKFNINELYIKKGDTIEFINYDQIRHTVVNDEPTIPNSDLLYQYDNYKHTFRKEGNFIFYSSLYPKMKPITIIVEETIKGRDFYSEIYDNIIIIFKEIINSLKFLKIKK